MALNKKKNANTIKRMKKTFHYNVLIHPEIEGGFTVTVPSLPGCITYGKDLDEAKKMAVEAIQLYLESLDEAGEEIQSDDGNFLTTLDISALVHA
jgi:predicted RNase H-like HicB family nuclease